MGHQQAERPFPLFRIATLFAASVLGVHLVYWLFLPARFFYPLQEATAHVVTLLLNLLGVSASCSGIMVNLPHGRWEIAMECTALSAVIVFLSFLIAYPSLARSKLVGALFGIPLLLFANMLRLLLLGLTTAHLPKIANYLHDYVWQVGFLILVAVCWVAWIDLVVKRERPTEIPV